MEQKICSLTPVISIYYNLNDLFILLISQILTNLVTLKLRMILYIPQPSTSKINTKIGFKTWERLPSTNCTLLSRLFIFLFP